MCIRDRSTQSTWEDIVQTQKEITTLNAKSSKLLWELEKKSRERGRRDETEVYLQEMRKQLETEIENRKREEMRRKEEKEREKISNYEKYLDRLQSKRKNIVDNLIFNHDRAEQSRMDHEWKMKHELDEKLRKKKEIQDRLQDRKELRDIKKAQREQEKFEEIIEIRLKHEQIMKEKKKQAAKNKENLEKTIELIEKLAQSCGLVVCNLFFVFLVLRIISH
eukprot:TRINITY_DN13425_c0_g1_i1.p1 TRINITY_DN13425_c0_g1~~TRINITY_DN13425_c0_g1_i1.p1  ORF type:complete len:221 (+),score=59.59 TRINITY_DN13425_c0_g1_i1:64-726(+)